MSWCCSMTARTVCRCPFTSSLLCWRICTPVSTSPSTVSATSHFAPPTEVWLYGWQADVVAKEHRTTTVDAQGDCHTHRRRAAKCSREVEVSRPLVAVECLQLHVGDLVVMPSKYIKLQTTNSLQTSHCWGI